MYQESGSGRPRGGSKLYEDSLKSIVPLAVKYDLDPNLLVDAFVEAWRKKKSSFKGLKIDRRRVDKDSAVFLVTRGGKAILQLPISLDALRTPEIFKRHIQYFPTPPSKLVKHRQMKIGKLQVGMRGVDIKAKVVEIPPKRLFSTRWGKSYVSNVKVSDETGSIRLSLWNNQIERIHIGDEVKIENGYVANFAGEPQLRLGRKGKMSVQ